VAVSAGHALALQVVPEYRAAPGALGTRHHGRMRRSTSTHGLKSINVIRLGHIYRDTWADPKDDCRLYAGRTLSCAERLTGTADAKNTHALLQEIMFRRHRQKDDMHAESTDADIAGDNAASHP